MRNGDKEEEQGEEKEKEKEEVEKEEEEDILENREFVGKEKQT